MLKCKNRFNKNRFDYKCLKQRGMIMRFFLEQAYGVGDEVILSKTDSRHISRVLRMRPGEEITVVSANRVYTAEIVAVGEDVSVCLQQELEAYTEAPLNLILLQGLAKGERGNCDTKSGGVGG